MSRLLCVLLVAGCTGKETETPDPMQPVGIVTDALAPAATGEVYTAWLEATGGEAPLRWEIEGALPEGLVFNPAGAISGVTGQTGSFPITVTVADDEGGSDSADLVLDVALGGSVVPCGGTTLGTFTEIADIDYDVVDWDATDGYAWLEVPLPPDDVTRVEIVVEPGMRAYVARPGTPAGSTELEDPYVNRWVDGASPIVVDLGTGDDLDTYRSFGEPIRVLLAAWEPTEWSMATICTDGPIFEYLTFAPTRLGEEVAVDFSVHGPDDGMVFTTDGPLPDWASWDESTGTITGTAAELGVWELDVTVTAPDGKQRTERSGFGVYDTVPLPCDTPVQISIDEPYDEGALSYDADPRGYVVFETPFDADLSEVTLTTAGLDFGLVGFSDPWYPPYYTGSAYDFVFYSSAELSLSPRTWPSPRHVEETGGLLHSTVKPYYTGADVDVLLTCDRGPRPDVPALPVLDPGVPVDVPLEARGGTPPYVWSSANLPAGVTLQPDGLLQSDGSVTAGASVVDLTVQDALLEERTVPYDLWVGEQAACGSAPILTCGDEVTGTLTSAFWDSTTNGSTGFCLSRDVLDSEWVAATVTSDETADLVGLFGYPGRMGTDAWLDNGGFYAVFANPEESYTGVIDADGRPSLADYAGLPVYLTILAYEPGGFTLAIECGN